MPALDHALRPARAIVRRLTGRADRTALLAYVVAGNWPRRYPRAEPARGGDRR
jgi:hypothetical protein